MIFYQSTHIHIHTYINKMFDYVLIINFLNDARESLELYEKSLVNSISISNI